MSCIYAKEFELKFPSPLLFLPPPSPSPSFNESVEGIRDWLRQMDLSLKSKGVLEAQSQQGPSDATEELERMENLLKELFARRCVYFGV